MVSIENNFYEILGVSKDASFEQIKSAYKAKARQWHPDKHAAHEKQHAESKFIEIQRAYEILSNPQQRMLYDNGQNSHQTRNNNSNFNQFWFMPHFTFTHHQYQPKQQQQPFENSDQSTVQITIKLKLREFYEGCEKKFGLSKKKLCSNCSQKCNHCNGSGNGVTTMHFGPVIQQRIDSCGVCNGVGILNRNSNNGNSLCNLCNGNKIQIENNDVNVQINKGMVPNETIKINPDKNNPNFSVYATLLEEDDDNSAQNQDINKSQVYKRSKYNNFDLETSIRITLSEALFGINKQLQHIDGHKFTISFNAETLNQNSVLIVPGKGMPKCENPLAFSDYGDLMVQISYIELPLRQKLGAETLKKLKENFPIDNRENVDATNSNNNFQIPVFIATLKQ